MIIKKQLKNIPSRIVLKIIKTVLFLFLITFTTHLFAKTNEYYKQTLLAPDLHTER